MLDRAERLSRWGQSSDAVTAYGEACAAPLDAGAHYIALLGLARSLHATGESQRAIDTCQEAIRRDPLQSAAYGILALVLMHEGELERAAIAASEACLRETASPAMLCLLATIELRRGRVNQAITASNAALRRDPRDQRAQALAALAKWHRDGVSDSLDNAALVRISNPSPPPGFGSVEAFNAAIARAVRSDPALAPANGHGPLVRGSRLPDLFTLPPMLVEAVCAMFLAAARSYAADIAKDERHRALATVRWPLTMRGWGNVMEQGAYEGPHIHDGAWLSGVYYPELPEPGSEGGEIVFGMHDLGPTVPSPAPYAVSPAVGQLILFPSYLYHSTRPFTGAGYRISLAADIMPGG